MSFTNESTAVKRRALLLSDFTMGNLVGLASRDPVFAEWDVEDAGFGQALPALMDPDHKVWQQEPPRDLVIIWVLPEAVVPSFRSLMRLDGTGLDALLLEVDAFARSVSALRNRSVAHSVIVVAWALPPGRGHGMLDWKPGGVAHTISRMNTRLAGAFADTQDVVVLDSQRWIAAAGASAWSPKLWFMGKVPFTAAVFLHALDDIRAAVEGMSGRARKLIVLDLDDTIWGGIVGDDGWRNLKLGGHDPEGEAFVEFQHELKALARRGVLLGIASRNDKAVALEAIREHPDMVLRESDFAGWRINWNDKAQNIASLVSELNLGLQSVVFIDDNPAERARVAEALPEVLVPDWPKNPLLYPAAIRELRCFDAPVVTSEDANRASMVASERKRRRLRQVADSFDTWMESLGLAVTVRPLVDEDLPRTVQLLNKTNQMNLSTRRLTESELLAWLKGEGRVLWTLCVSDRFGDYGLTGILSIEVDSERGCHLVDFVLSCRVMGRRVEETMLHVATQQARDAGASKLIASYLPTEKNRPCLEFFDSRSGFGNDGEGNFKWDLSNDYPLPDGVNLPLCRA